MSDRDKYQQLRRDGKLHGTIKRAVNLRSERWTRKQVALAIAANRTRKTCKTREGSLEVVPLCRKHRRDTSAEARKLYPRRSNWDSATANESSRSVEVEDIDNGSYSRGCKFTHWTYVPHIRSAGACTPRRLLYFFAGGYRKIGAPRGWMFGLDDLGLYVARTGQTDHALRFHFDSGDLDSTTALRSAALEHERINLEFKREAKRKRREDKTLEKFRRSAIALGVWVCLRDSIRAGNCSAGSVRWCRDNGLDHTSRYPIEDISRLAIQSGREGQVARALQHATDRAALDLSRGFSSISSTN